MVMFLAILVILMSGHVAQGQVTRPDCNDPNAFCLFEHVDGETYHVGSEKWPADETLFSLKINTAKTHYIFTSECPSGCEGWKIKVTLVPIRITSTGNEKFVIEMERGREEKCDKFKNVSYFTGEKIQQFNEWAKCVHFGERGLIMELLKRSAPKVLNSKLTLNVTGMLRPSQNITVRQRTISFSSTLSLFEQKRRKGESISTNLIIGLCVGAVLFILLLAVILIAILKIRKEASTIKSHRTTSL